MLIHTAAVGLYAPATAACYLVGIWCYYPIQTKRKTPPFVSSPASPGDKATHHREAAFRRSPLVPKVRVVAATPPRGSTVTPLGSQKKGENIGAAIVARAAPICRSRRRSPAVAFPPATTVDRATVSDSLHCCCYTYCCTCVPVPNSTAVCVFLLPYVPLFYLRLAVRTVPAVRVCTPEQCFRKNGNGA